MALRVTVVSDFVCPYCYYLEALLARVGERLDLDIDRRPFELTERPTPQEDPARDPVRRARYEETLAPACRDIGLSMHLPPAVSPRPYTDLAFQGWLFAKTQGRDAAYHSRVFRAYFEEERDIGDMGELTALAVDAGLDGAAFRRALEEGTFAPQERQAARDARETLRVTVVPTIFAGGARLEGFVPSQSALETFLRKAKDQS